jgi:hypothetical protein
MAAQLGYRLGDGDFGAFERGGGLDARHGR